MSFGPDDPLPWIRLVLGTVMLVGAAVADLRTRRVANPFWMPYLVLALVLAVVDLLVHGWRSPEAVRLAVAAGVVPLFYAFWYFGLFGGADAKGLMVLTLLVPAFPDPSRAPLPALDAVANGALLIVALPLLLGLLNIAKGRFRFPAALVGVPMDIEAARRRHVWPMQWPNGAGGLRWRYMTRPGEPIEGVYDGLHSMGVRQVWVTYKIPFLAVLPFGFLLAAFWGDVVLVLFGLA